MSTELTDPPSPDTLPAAPARHQRFAAAWARVFEGNLWILLILGTIVCFFTITSGTTFLAVDNGRNIALDTSQVLLLTIGQTFVLITAGVDLSVGSVLVFSGVVAAKVMVAIAGTPETTGVIGEGATTVAGPSGPVGLAIVAGMLAGIAAGTAWGAFNGWAISRLRIPPLIVTLGTFGMALGIANLLTNGVAVPNVPAEIQTTVGSSQVAGAIPVPVLVTAIAVVVAYFLLHRTRFGRHTFATGSNPEAARRAGIRVDAHLVKVYAISGFLAGVAGIIDLARFDTITPSTHTTDNLNSIAAAAIGGTSLFGGVGTILGGVIAAFIPAVLQNGLVIRNIQPFWQQVLVGAIIIVAVYVDQWRRRRRNAK
ncbi:MAG: ribose transport system permease protein [Thermoleophilaceae bacterium]|jgi:ribose transport system permease protein|nr:ribose transport system permease protein [Thermoleophilaceae bacterium]